jgi:hypothetical protein
MAHVQEPTASKPSACLKVILLVANDDITLRSLAHVLSQQLHSHLFVGSTGFATVKCVRHRTSHLLIVPICATSSYESERRCRTTLPDIILPRHAQSKAMEGT